MNFEYSTAQRVIFGPGSSEKIVPDLAQLGRRALFVTGRDASRSEPFRKKIVASGVDLFLFQVESEPTVDLVSKGAQICRKNKCEFLVGFGGGGAIDAAKAISIFAVHPGDPLDYLEVVGKGKAFSETPLPTVAIPTTAGTGSEVTKNSVLASLAHRVKVSVRSPLMLPRIACVDPALTLNLPPVLTASTGMDALSQLLEPYVSNGANPLTDVLCREGLSRAARSLKKACQNGNDLAARTEMSFAALLSGMALANAKLGAVHGIAAPLGGMAPVPHGTVCALLLGPVIKMNVQLLRKREPGHPALERYREAARIITGVPTAKAENTSKWVDDFCAEMAIPRLSKYGLKKAEFPLIAQKAAASNSMKGNPVLLTEEQIIQLIDQAY